MGACCVGPLQADPYVKFLSMCVRALASVHLMEGCCYACVSELGWVEGLS